MQNAIMVLGAAVVLMILILMHYRRRIDALEDSLAEERSRSRSLSTVYGQINEQWFPLMDRYPYDSQYFRFIGTPVDGIQFEDDRIVFCEFKTNQSALTSNQRRIKEIVESGEVYWEEFNFSA